MLVARAPLLGDPKKAPIFLAFCCVLWSAAFARAHERKKGIIGFIGKEGKLVFSNAELHEAGSFTCGLALARIHVDGALKYGFLDTTGKFRIEPRFDAASSFSEGLAFVTLRTGEMSGYIDTAGKPRVEKPIEAGGAFSEGLAFFRGGGKVKLP